MCFARMGKSTAGVRSPILVVLRRRSYRCVVIPQSMHGSVGRPCSRAISLAASTWRGSKGRPAPPPRRCRRRGGGAATRSLPGRPDRVLRGPAATLRHALRLGRVGRPQPVPDCGPRVGRRTPGRGGATAAGRTRPDDKGARGRRRRVAAGGPGGIPLSPAGLDGRGRLAPERRRRRDGPMTDHGVVTLTLDRALEAGERGLA